MNRKVTLKELSISLGDIAKWWAVAGDEEQAALFNELGEAFYACKYDKGIQACYMTSALEEKGRWLINELAGFLAVKNEQ